MARPCQICQKSWKDQLEGRIRAGEAARSLAVEFGVSEMSISRHMNRHTGDGRGAKEYDINTIDLAASLVILHKRCVKVSDQLYEELDTIPDIVTQREARHKFISSAGIVIADLQRSGQLNILKQALTEKRTLVMHIVDLKEKAEKIAKRE
jgi:hypothetical protein